MKTYLRKTSTGFEIEPGFEAEFDKIANGSTVRATIQMPRNVGFHRKFFAMLNLGFENQELFKTPDAFRNRILIDSGHYEFAEDYSANYMIKAKSISFANMDQIEFERVYEDVFTTMMDFICQGKHTTEDRQLFEQELLNFT